MRLNKYLSESGAWSRREADRLIEERRVTINGVVVGLGTQVAAGDEVKVDGDVVGQARKHAVPVYIALNKPIGITCTTERHVEGNIIDFIDHPERIFPIGRLDKESEGLILLTNDGDIVNEVLRAEHDHEKEYIVRVERPFFDEFAERMAAGVRLSDATTKRCKVTRLDPRTFSIILTQGLNRQIRRMCAALGYEVVSLQRIRIMHIRLADLPVGRWRNLTPDELAALIPKTLSPHPNQRAAGSPQPSPRPEPRRSFGTTRPARPQAPSRPGGRHGGGRRGRG